MIYLDTSALVKRYVAEEGSHMVRDLFLSGQRLLTSRVAYAEALAAYFRRFREGSIVQSDLETVCHWFEREWEERIDVISLTDAVTRQIRQMVSKYPLRGLDAIHLASALFIRERTQGDHTFVGSDARLLDAAGAEGFNVLNPELA